MSNLIEMNFGKDSNLEPGFARAEPFTMEDETRKKLEHKCNDALILL